MSTGTEQLRTELERKFQPPIDVLLDPSLLVANRTLKQLNNSTIFASQTQATLGRSPTQPRLGDLYVPKAFQEVISPERRSTRQQTAVWEFYRGQADTALPKDVSDTVEQNDVNAFADEEVTTVVQPESVDADFDRESPLINTLEQEFSFLQSGGLILSRIPAAFEAFRDSGVTTIDIGEAELSAELDETLTDIGYGDPASICAFGIANTGSIADALVSELLKHNSNHVLYQVGQ